MTVRGPVALSWFDRLTMTLEGRRPSILILGPSILILGPFIVVLSAAIVVPSPSGVILSLSGVILSLSGVILSLSKDDGERPVAWSWFDRLTMTLGELTMTLGELTMTLTRGGSRGRSLRSRFASRRLAS
jgi:hypothetical protein